MPFADWCFSAIIYGRDLFFPAVYEAIQIIVLAPVRQHELLWTTLPLLVTLLLMEFYFGKYSKEELGWNTAVANSLVLIFVSLSLFKYLLQDESFAVEMLLDMSVKTFLAALVLVLGIWGFIVDFFHVLPKRLAFRISSALPIYFTAYVAIVLVRTDILDNPTTLNYVATGTAILSLFLATAALFWAIHAIEPRSEAD
jgi:hypothetical protein